MPIVLDILFLVARKIEEECGRWEVVSAAMSRMLVQELFSNMIPRAPADPVFHPFTVSICDRMHGSQIPVFHVRLRHILFEEALAEFVTHLHRTLVQPLSQGDLSLFDARDQLVEFFAEGAEITVDENLNYYDEQELTGIMSQFDPVLSFTIYYPHTGATRVHLLRSPVDVQDLHDPLRGAALLQ